MTTAQAEADHEPSRRALVAFCLDSQRYAVSLGLVERALRVIAITALAGAPDIVLGVVDLAGEVLPVIDLRKRFGHPSRPIRLADQLLVATTGKRRVALLVDATIGVIQLSPETFEAAGDILPHLALVDGVIKLEDGLVVIQDLERLLSLEEQQAIDDALRSSSDVDGDSERGAR